MKPYLPEEGRPLISHIGVPYYWTDFDSEALREISAALQPGQEDIWSNFIDHYQVTEGIAFLETCPEVRKSVRAPEYDCYVLDAQLQSMGDLLERINDPAVENDQVSMLLAASESRLRELLKPNILTLVANGAPPSGHLMYFTSHLHRCLVIRYEVLNNNTVYVAVETTIPKPKTVFDVFDNIDKFTPRARNVLKTMLASGHKIVGHRNTLVHVDRRNDLDVFGPSIDTLYLNEMLFKYLYEYEHLRQPKIDFSKFRNSPQDYAGFDAESTPMFANVLEIGCGNGLLITTFIRNVAWFDQFVAIDPSIKAIACTYRSSAGQRTNKNQRVGEAKGSYICSRFDPGLLNRDFDVVICNPPYIPLPPSQERVRGPFIEAVGGTELLAEVLQALPRLLSRRGLLFMVYSSLADPEFRQSLPEGVVVEPLGAPDGIEVPFDVESVLDNKTWLNWLIDHRNLTRRQDLYYHRIKCVALHLTEEAGFEDKWGLLARIKQMNLALNAIYASAPNEVVLNPHQPSDHEPELGLTTEEPVQNTIMLRFRNLSGTGTDTVSEHRKILDARGYVWWGWWKRQTEITPRELFSELSRRIKHHKSADDVPLIYLFDNGTGMLYSARLLQLESQPNRSIPCREPSAVPEYYRGQEHAAWFKLGSITPEPSNRLQSFIYSGFPTLTSSTSALTGKHVAGWDELSQSLVTLWWIGVPQRSS